MESHVITFRESRGQTNTWVGFISDFISISQKKFQTDIDEVVLLPKGKGKKYATSCIRSDTRRTAVGKMFYCPLKHCHRENMAGVERFLWMATVKRWLGQLWIQDGATAQMTAEVRIPFLKDHCLEGGMVLSRGKLQITNLDLLRSGDCQTLCRSSRV